MDKRSVPVFKSALNRMYTNLSDVQIECHPAVVDVVPDVVYSHGVKLSSGMSPMSFKLTYEGLEISRTVSNVYDKLTKKHIGYNYCLLVSYNGETADFKDGPTIKSKARDVISALVRTKRLKVALSDVLCDGVRLLGRK